MPAANHCDPPATRPLNSAAAALRFATGATLGDVISSSEDSITFQALTTPPDADAARPSPASPRRRPVVRLAARPCSRLRGTRCGHAARAARDPPARRSTCCGCRCISKTRSQRLRNRYARSARPREALSPPRQRCGRLLSLSLPLSISLSLSIYLFGPTPTA